MDNLTHTAVGLFLSRVGLGRWSARGAAILVIAANIPDIDMVTLLGGPVNYLHYHRHLTHSLAAMPLMALAAVAIVRLVGRKPVSWRAAFFAALIAVASHLCLDWTNIYGIRLLLPFSGEWFRADTTNVIDLWILAVIAIGIAGPFLARLVGSEISSGPARNRHHGRGFAWFALLFFLALRLWPRRAARPRGGGSRLSPVRRCRAATRGGPSRFGQSLCNGAESSRPPMGYVVQDLNLANQNAAERPASLHKPVSRPGHGGRPRNVSLSGIPALLPIPPLARDAQSRRGERQGSGSLRHALRHAFSTGLCGARGGGSRTSALLEANFQYGTMRPR